jgi:hypothetical protein
MWKTFLEYMPFLFALVLALKSRYYLAIHAWLLKVKNVHPSQMRDVVFSETILSMLISPYVAIVYCTSVLAVSNKTKFLPLCLIIFVVQSIAAGVTYAILTPPRMVLSPWTRRIPMLIEFLSIGLSAGVFCLAQR